MILKRLSSAIPHSMYKYLFTKRSYSETSKNSPKVCVVGAGPAGFYATQHIIKTLPNASVDIIEKLPVPFGLVRFGVAPDHPEVKNVINTFTKTAENDRVRFIGNLSLGKDISLQTLRDSYNAVVLCYGAAYDRHLGIPNEDGNVLSAREFVDWYNGIPDSNETYSVIEQHLRKSSTVSIIGQGNVAMDVARILLSPIDELRKTDITERSLNTLAESSIHSVHFIGRRGPLQAAFTIKELREMLTLSKVHTAWRSSDFIGIDDEFVKNLPRPKKRITELMLKSVKTPTNGEKCFSPIFFRSPKEIIPIENSKRKKIILTVNRLSENAAIATNEFETIETDLIFRSIGYKGLNVCDDLPFDNVKGIIPNKRGRILQNVQLENIEKGLYVSGWLGTGPVGVILTTMSNSFGVAETLCNDWKENRIDKNVKNGIDILHYKDSISWKQWQRIDSIEISNGKKTGKPREKFLNIREMLNAAK